MNTRQYFKLISMLGYTYSKDELGYYFDNRYYRASIMKTGNYYNCYLNKKEDKKFILTDKLLASNSFNECLKWVVMSIQKNNLKK